MAGVVVGVLIVLGVEWLATDSLRDNFLANFLATLAGVMFGVPIAVWLTVRESNEDRKAARTEAADRRIEVLTAVRRELIENQRTLVERRPDGARREFFIPFLMDEVWAAVSDGGQLQWVGDVEVLRRAARAYVFIRTIIYLERQVFELAHHPSPTLITKDGPVGAADAPIKQIVSYLDHQDRVCLAAIDEAFEVLDPILGPRSTV